VHKVPWLIDPTGSADEVLAHFVAAKHKLMPYLYSSAIHTHRLGVPMLRAQFLEYPDDPSAWYQNTSYFLGGSLFVAPVFNAEGDVQYYLPHEGGEWYGILDGKMRQGGKYHCEKHDVFSLPVLLRPGGVIVQGSRKDVAVYWAKDVTILINYVEEMNTSVLIPDYETGKEGEFKAQLLVKSKKTGQVNVIVTDGKLVGTFVIKVVHRKVKASSTTDVEVSGDSTVKVKADIKEVRLEIE
jgi:alpha-D-xyloside xylohydrolase